MRSGMPRCRSTQFFAVVLATVVLAVGCRSAETTVGDSGPTTSVLSSQERARDDCISTLTRMVDAAVDAQISNPQAVDALLNNFIMQYGTASGVFRAFMRIYPITVSTASRLGVARASANAFTAIQSECAALHPLPTTTTIYSATTSPSADENAGSVSSNGGTAVASLTLSGECLSGEVRSGLPVVSCVIGAWRSGLLATSWFGLISAEAKAALVAVPVPTTIEDGECVELETTSGDSFTGGPFADIGCTFDLDGNQMLRVTLGTYGASLGSSVKAVELTTG